MEDSVDIPVQKKFHPSFPPSQPVPTTQRSRIVTGVVIKRGRRKITERLPKLMPSCKVTMGGDEQNNVFRPR